MTQCSVTATSLIEKRRPFCSRVMLDSVVEDRLDFLRIGSHGIALTMKCEETGAEFPRLCKNHALDYLASCKWAFNQARA